MEMQAFDLLSEPVKRLLAESGFMEPTPPQVVAIPKVLRRENILLIAPTGSGKTEAVLLPIVDQLIRNEGRQGISILYITPLRALNRDLLKRLMAWGEKLGFTIEIRHGDTPTRERRRQALKPPDFLITTPETLQAILPGRRIREHLKHIRWVVVDEIHELADDRRGVQLTIGLERLREITQRDFQRIGLSATVGNPTEIAAFLGGAGRSVEVIQVSPPKQFKYLVEYPYPTEEDHDIAQALYLPPEAAARLTRISELIDRYNSTLVFVNSRTNAEMLGSKFEMLHRNIMVHHGSLPREERVRAENALKNGEVNGLICTSTLELGIDIGSVDLVLQYMSPRQVNALIQRVGRSGHSLERTSEGIIIAVSTDDVLESVAIIEQAKRSLLEPIKMHRNALDVLAHQIAGILLDSDGGVAPQEMLGIIRRAHPYANLSDEDFGKVVKFMERLHFLKRGGGLLTRTRRTRRYYFENLSMIPDERRYPVVDLTTQQVVGILGEEFMTLKARVGLNFIVKGKVWQIQAIGGDGQVYVTPVVDPTAAIPGWAGEMLPVPYEVAMKVGELRAEISDMLDSMSATAVLEELTERWPAERLGVRKVVDEIRAQRDMGAPVPTHKTILLEAFDRFLIIHACFGEVVNSTLGELFEELLRRSGLVRSWWSDGYRILIELTVSTENLDLEGLREDIFHADQAVVNGAFNFVIHRHVPFVYHMKFIAERFGALRRGLALSGDQLKELAIKFRHTPIYDEAVREMLLLHLDLDRAREIYRDIQAGRIELRTFRSMDRPTPLAYKILYKHLEVPELIAPDMVAKDNLERLRIAIDSKVISLLCFNCSELIEEVHVGSLPEMPRCRGCGSSLLAPIFWSAEYVKRTLDKKRRREPLDENEEKALVNARRSADLVLAYGRRAIISQSVYGIGPQTAAKILAKMHESEEEFYKDLLEAKLKFITTRPYWDIR